MKTWVVCAITVCIIAVGCSYGGRPAISLGTGIDEKTSGVTGFTDRFLLKDTIAYSLTQNRPFGFSGITLRFYKGKNIFEMERIVNEDISLVPEAVNPGLETCREIWRRRLYDSLYEKRCGDCEKNVCYRSSAADSRRADTRRFN